MKTWLFCLLCLFLTACESKQIPPPAIRPIQYKRVEPIQPFQTKIFSGVAKARTESKLSFRIPGRIDEILVHVGDPIAKDDRIAALDKQDFLLHVEETEASVFQTEAEQKRASSDYARAKELYETQSASRAELDAARATFESATARLEAAKTKRAIAKTRLKYTCLKAPSNGHIAEVMGRINENVKEGEPIVVVTSDEALEVTTAIPEAFIGLLKKGQEAKVTFDALPGNFFAATVTEVGILSGTGTTFPLTVQLDSPSLDLRAGMSAEVTLQFPQTIHKNALFVPPQAVLEKGGKRILFIVNPEQSPTGRVEEREVVTGLLTNAGIEILSGLTTGNLVVTAGIHFLKGGDLVLIDPKCEER